ncbi:MAG TPA: ATPase [Gammaproteobacteria bacterium]|nr:ATPase [Gammaproteobacteria bacterium]
MLQRLYIHNFRCLENFELPFKDMPSALLIGKNGAGKSTVGTALEILQRIGRGINRVGHLVQIQDFARGRTDVPIRFEIEVLIDDKLYQYTLALEWPKQFEELRIFEEQLLVSGEPLYSRQGASVTLHDTQFMVDWHLVALPVIQRRSEADPLHLFKMWLARMIILAPIPSLMTGESKGETLKPKRNGSNFGEWFSGLLIRYPAAYMQVDKYLREVMPDIEDFQNEFTGKESKILSVQFQANQAEMRVDFKDLSDGEKCFFICAVVLAANKSYGPLFCFWDEPDSFLSLSEVGHFITSLRRSFEKGGQILATSHHSEAIRKFSNENTLVLYRKNHLEPTLIKRLSEMSFKGDLVDTLIRGDIAL